MRSAIVATIDTGERRGREGTGNPRKAASVAVDVALIQATLIVRIAFIQDAPIPPV
jgi:hypothetical protein